MGFANLYWCFIQRFISIAAPLTSKLKTTPSTLLPANVGRSVTVDDNEISSGGGGGENNE